MKPFYFHHTDDDPKVLRREFKDCMKSVLPGTVYWRIKPEMIEEVDFDTTVIKYCLVARGWIGPISNIPYVDISKRDLTVLFPYPDNLV